jgi:hypothetical protein
VSPAVRAVSAFRFTVALRPDATFFFAVPTVVSHLPEYLPTVGIIHHDNVVVDVDIFPHIVLLIEPGA